MVRRYLPAGLLIIFSFITLSGIATRGEKNFIELFTNIILTSGLLLTLINRKKLRKRSTFWGYISRVFVFIFLIYEELSGLWSKDKFAYFNLHNMQSEANAHNLKFMGRLILKDVEVPFINHSFSMTFSTAIYAVALLVISYGAFAPWLRELKGLFFEKDYAFYGLIYIPLIGAGSILRHFGHADQRGIVEQELVELFYYAILILDTFRKISLSNKISNVKSSLRV